MTATWYTASTAQSDIGISVTDKQLAAAREQCLRVKGLPLGLSIPPSESFAQGVVYQALANKQASQASAVGELGGEAHRVNVTPLDHKIMSMLIIPAPSTGAVEPVTLTWPTGERIELSRSGDIVTAVVYPRQDAVRMFPATMPIPDRFGFTGGDAVFIVTPADPNPSWNFQLSESGNIVQPVGAFGTVGPYSPNPAVFQWVADPLPDAVDSRDTGFIGSLIG